MGVRRKSTSTWKAAVLLCASLGVLLGLHVLNALAVEAEPTGRPVAENLPASADRQINFMQEVQPILQTHCAECHGNDTEEGGLNLTVRSRVFEGGDSVKPIVRGQSEKSPLVHLVAGLDEDRIMPPEGDRLSNEQIGILRAWIDQGAVWPDEASGQDQRQLLARQHWAFQPIRRPQVPEVTNRQRIHNDIDAFVMARLERAGLRPARHADELTLLRRIHYDLIGLPPPAKAVLECANHTNGISQNYNELIEELLHSPHYGERYGRHWLDVVRYSDSAGYELDTAYEHAWKYRDYVIRSINDNKPFDRFIQEQLAADELWPQDDSLRHATGLLTVGPYQFESGIFRPEIQDYKWRTDIADTISSAFVGLTAGCARCHSHKFDPISQKDYFGLHAILGGSTLWDTRISRPPDNSDERKEPQNWVIVSRKAPATIRVLHRGDLKTPGDTAQPAIFRSLPGGGVFEESEPASFKRRRSELARWLTSTKNPLTARVLANRIWQWHFGTGLVRTPNDFGTQGEPPTHPQLLDYLADELRTHDWSMQHLHRLIMQSSTYQMSSQVVNSAASTADPNNTLLWHFPRRRLEAEAIWDSLHATAGTLNRRQFGRPVVPPVDEAILATKVGSNWEVTKDRSQWARRGIYVVVRRSIKFPFFETFNINEPSASCGSRDATVVSPQAFTLFNDEIVVGQAQAFAGRLLNECGTDLDKTIRQSWLHAFSRPISDDELVRSRRFVQDVERQLAAGPTDELISPTGELGEIEFSAQRGAALVEYCRAIFNTNEFLYVD